MFEGLRIRAQKNCTGFTQPLFFCIHQKRRAGFTLIEILVVVAIMGILLAIMSQGFANYAYRQDFRSTVGDIRDGIAEARQKTLASFSDTTYGIYIGTTTVEFFSGASYIAGDSNNVIIPVSGGMSATPSFSNGLRYVTFARLTGALSATGTIVISDTRSNSSTTFILYASGLVE